ncbi:AlpA family transcriptional regulator [Pseudonocardia sp. MH-G8]|uniref:helix-turn-helix transcriptional regulator n=1 Tax=Pseudonocardia sp. MH-G8 TaxID=1854588 RepID=UPI000BA07C94|nr:helix-turn-helix domain-containing protein [Pseudonocardia sp. MH-G8]OZM83585.1 MerR family DNA-binding transcriptional regulator [Pseudonocardia sp. MH-G8]
MGEERLISTGEVARAVGLSRQTIQRYMREGLLTPVFTTTGGHARWRLDEVLEQLRALHRRAE